MPGHEPVLRKSVVVGDAADRLVEKLARYKDTRRRIAWLLLSAPAILSTIAVVSYLIYGWDEGTRIFTALAAALMAATLYLAWLLWREERTSDTDITRTVNEGLAAVNEEVRRTGEQN